MSISLASVQPFEICSIRPPTENSSLTFRLTRNCYWNKCGFCPVYKFGAKFSRRELAEVLEDVKRARRLEDLMRERGINVMTSYGKAYEAVEQLASEIISAAGPSVCASEPEQPVYGLDPQLEWFLSWFKDKPDIRDSLQHILAWRFANAETCFLGDADSLILKPEFLGAVLADVRDKFPTLKRFTVYGRTRSAARSRKSEDLEAYCRAGLHRVHFGLESGSDTVLKMINKGETRDDHIAGGIKVREAGLSCSVYIMPGLGGVEHSDEHAEQTSDVINRIKPEFVRLRTLQIFPRTPIDEACNSGNFTEVSESGVISEIRKLIERITVPVKLYSDSAVNLIQVNGSLPDDRQSMLERIDKFLALSEREQLVFSLEGRLASFMGQYGGMTQDIYELLAPYAVGRELNYPMMLDENIREVTRLIRSKLMP